MFATVTSLPYSKMVIIIVVKFEEINLKSKKFEKVQDVIKFKNVQDPHSVTTVLLSKDTRYCQHCNNVKLHAVQYTSTRFLTNARFNNKG